jgi:UDP-N-acetylglucosamine 2-epimerase (non-hydrolysing)
MLKVLSVFGTRPEAIKMAPLIQELARRHPHIISKVCVTGQHRELLDQVLQVFDIVPNYDLDVMEHNQSPTQVTAAVLSRLEAILTAETPDWVLIQGDTTTTAAAALAAFHAGAKIGHVEAGLRTSVKRQPFPEEVNRRIVSLLADLHFAPTPQARQNLLAEGIKDSHIVVTGNTVVDALQGVLSRPVPSELTTLLQKVGVLNGLGASSNGNGKHSSGNGQSSGNGLRKLIVVTAHRRESHGQPLNSICTALRAIAIRYGESIHIVYPVHPNPNVWNPVQERLSNLTNVTLLPPLDYVTMAHLMNYSYLIITDSGGLQEEAPSMQKPLLLLREITDRSETVVAGAAFVIGTETETVMSAIVRLLEDTGVYQSMVPSINPYGDGRASVRIADALTSFS